MIRKPLAAVLCCLSLYGAFCCIQYPFTAYSWLLARGPIHLPGAEQVCMTNLQFMLFCCSFPLFVACGYFLAHLEES